MSEISFFHYLLSAWFTLAGAIFVALLFIVAPYGRHITKHLGATLKSSTAWIVMECTSPVVFAVCFIFGQNRNTLPVITLLILWETHYIHRAFFYPLHRRDGDKRMPVMVVALGFIFNGVNSYLNGRYIFTLSSGYPETWLRDPRFIAGVLLFILGFIINRQADFTLHNLRKEGETGYSVANNGLFRWVSCPNYLGEIMIWTGWAIATWSLAGLSFAVWTAANLVPRARAHHHWYRRNFPEYPANRKTMVPGIW
jgi:3-oxo-5-alpha-steroid 4-dehydrogenase 1